MAKRTNVNFKLESTIRALLFDEPVAYHPLIARAVGSVTAGVLLAQLLYWTPRTDRPDGWFYKTRDELYQETALTRTEQETARKALKQLGVLEEDCRGLPAKRYFRVNIDRLTELLSSASEAADPPARWRQSYPQGGRNPATKAAETPPASTEITTETTPEITNREMKPSSNRVAFSRKGERDRPDADQAIGADRIRQALRDRGLLPAAAHTRSSGTTPPDRSEHRRSEPPPEYIAAVIADVVKELGDTTDTAANVSQAMALWEHSGVAVQAFVDLVFETQAVVRSRRSVRNRLGYFFTCLRRSLPSETGAAQPGTTQSHAALLATGQGHLDSQEKHAPSGPQRRSDGSSAGRPDQ